MTNCFCFFRAPSNPKHVLSLHDGRLCLFAKDYFSHVLSLFKILLLTWAFAKFVGVLNLKKAPNLFRIYVFKGNFIIPIEYVFFRRPYFDDVWAMIYPTPEPESHIEWLVARFSFCSQNNVGKTT